MAVKKRGGSKNSIENRGEKTLKTCVDCGKPQKAIRMFANGKNKMIFECPCGFKDRAGTKVII